MWGEWFWILCIYLLEDVQNIYVYIQKQQTTKKKTKGPFSINAKTTMVQEEILVLYLLCLFFSSWCSSFSLSG